MKSGVWRKACRLIRRVIQQRSSAKFFSLSVAQATKNSPVSTRVNSQNYSINFHQVPFTNGIRYIIWLRFKVVIITDLGQRQKSA